MNASFPVCILLRLFCSLFVAFCINSFLFVVFFFHLFFFFRIFAIIFVVDVVVSIFFSFSNSSVRLKLSNCFVNHSYPRKTFPSIRFFFFFFFVRSAFFFCLIHHFFFFLSSISKKVCS